jgi:hypothetical protein
MNRDKIGRLPVSDLEANFTKDSNSLYKEQMSRGLLPLGDPCFAQNYSRPCFDHQDFGCSSITETRNPRTARAKLGVHERSLLGALRVGKGSVCACFPLKGTVSLPLFPPAANCIRTTTPRLIISTPGL